MRVVSESILGIDPSLKKTGLCLLSPHEKFVVLDRIEYKDPFVKDFKHTYLRMVDIGKRLLRFVDEFVPEAVIMEAPLPQGQFSAGLTGLASCLVSQLLSKISLVYLLHPSYLKFLLKKKKYKHSEIVELARLIMEEEHYNMNRKRMSADEAVAFLYAYRIYVRENNPKVCGRERFRIEKEVSISWGEIGEGV